MKESIISILEKYFDKEIFVLGIDRPRMRKFILAAAAEIEREIAKKEGKE